MNYFIKATTSLCGREQDIIDDGLTTTGKTWSSEKIQNQFGLTVPCLYIGSEQLLSSYSIATANANTAILGAYGRGLIIPSSNFPFNPPDGYAVRCFLSFQCTSNSSISIRFSLNKHSPTYTSLIGTYSQATFRNIGRSSLFNPYEIPLETTLGYSQEGVNLYVHSNSGSGTATAYDIRIHWLYVKV